MQTPSAALTHSRLISFGPGLPIRNPASPGRQPDDPLPSSFGLLPRSSVRCSALRLHRTRRPGWPAIRPIRISSCSLSPLLEVADVEDLPVVGDAGVHEADRVDGELDEPDRTVCEHGVEPAGVRGAEVSPPDIVAVRPGDADERVAVVPRSDEHTSEL